MAYGRDSDGKDREGEGMGMHQMGVVRMLRFTNAVLVKISHHSFSFPFVFFLLSLSLTFASNIICAELVSGSFIGISLLFAADHQPVALSNEYGASDSIAPESFSGVPMQVTKGVDGWLNMQDQEPMPK